MSGIGPILLVLAIVAALIALVLKRLIRPKDEAKDLRERYIRRLGMPESMAEQVIEAQRSKLRRKFPGRSERWYLEKMLYDLERDRG